MTIAYDRTGTGPPLVLLHPLGADRHVWDPLTITLRRTHELFAIDLPGFGDSPPLSGVTPTPAALADAVGALLRRLGFERPHVAGISLGGWVALELGLSGAAASVTAIAPAGLWSAPLRPKRATSHMLARALSPLIGPLASSSRGRRLLLSGTVAHPERVPAGDAARLVRAYGRATDYVAVNDAMRARRFTALQRIDCPVTLVWPDQDRLVDRPATLPPNVTSVTLTDAGHVPVWDAPDRLAALIGSRTHDPWHSGEVQPSSPA
jgi:pimeloyl-ACP methyl ester carboxylesterase